MGKRRQKDKYELTEAIAACIGNAHVQDRQSQSLRQRSEHELPSLTEKLFAIHTCWQRESVFSNGVSLGMLTTIQGRPHAQEKLPNITWTLCCVCFCLYFHVSVHVFCFTFGVNYLTALLLVCFELVCGGFLYSPIIPVLLVLQTGQEDRRIKKTLPTF